MRSGVAGVGKEETFRLWSVCFGVPNEFSVWKVFENGFLVVQKSLSSHTKIYDCILIKWINCRKYKVACRAATATNARTDNTNQFRYESFNWAKLFRKSTATDFPFFFLKKNSYKFARYFTPWLVPHRRNRLSLSLSLSTFIIIIIIIESHANRMFIEFPKVWQNSRNS